MNMKKTICVLLTIALLWTLSIPTAASGLIAHEDETSLQLSTRLNDAFDEVFGVLFDGIATDNPGIRLDDYQVMRPLTFNGSNRIYHFPIADSSGVVCWILSIVLNEDNSYGATIGEDFAPMLNKALANGQNQIYLVQEGWSLYAIAGKQVYTQNGSEVVRMSSTEVSQLNLLIPDGTVSSLLIVDSTLSNKARQSYQNYVATQTLLNTASTEQSEDALSDYPHIYLGMNGLCWAATVASMIRYEKPSIYPNLTAANVADQLGVPHNNGGYPSEIVSALNYYLGSPYLPTHLSRILNYSEIQVIIGNNDPAYLRMLSDDESMMHGVALIGYDIGSTYARIKIMDPSNYNLSKYCVESSSGNWQFVYGDTIMYWRETVRLYYS